MKYLYPAVFTPLENGEFDVKVPDLPGCRTCGKTLEDAIFMAQDAVSLWLWDAESKAEEIPKATELENILSPQFTNDIIVDTEEYRKKIR